MIQVDPDTLDARPLLASALIQKGRIGEAILYLEEDLAIYPNDTAVRRILQATWPRPA